MSWFLVQRNLGEKKSSRLSEDGSSAAGDKGGAVEDCGAGALAQPITATNRCTPARWLSFSPMRRQLAKSPDLIAFSNVSRRSLPKP